MATIKNVTITIHAHTEKRKKISVQRKLKICPKNDKKSFFTLNALLLTRINNRPQIPKVRNFCTPFYRKDTNL